MRKALTTTDLPGVKLFTRGKVRDVYDLGDRLLYLVELGDRVEVAAWSPSAAG